MEDFEEWAESTGIPFEDARYEILNDDGTFATVRITATIRENEQSGWREMQSDIECRVVAGEWRCDPALHFVLSQAEQERLAVAREATSTAVAATRTAQEATATAEWNQVVDATATGSARRTLTAVSADATAVSANATATSAAEVRKATATAKAEASMATATSAAEVRRATATAKAEASMATATAEQEAAIATATAIAILTPTSTPPPTATPQVIESENPGVSIVVYATGDNSDQGRLQLRVVSGDEPLAGLEFLFRPVVRDITGQWTFDLQSGGNSDTTLYTTKSDGTTGASLDPGNYAAQLFGHIRGAAMAGPWGILVPTEDAGHKVETVVFPVSAGKLTDVTISLARLEIGVTREAEAVRKEWIWFYCQGTDVAGEKIPDIVRCYDYGHGEPTDARGVATFNLAESVYMIEIDLGWNEVYHWYDVSVKAGETRQEILELP